MNNTAKKSIGILLVICGILLFGATIVHGFYWAPEKETVLDPSFFLATSTDPVRIRIPTIGVNAHVEQVGITYKGNMSTPKILSDTGWYKYGTIPGENGSSVIDGHVDNGFSLPGVFKNLKNVAIGDDVYIDTENGQTLHFKVIDTEEYYYTQVPLDLLFNKTGASYLNLITCDGNWISSAETDDHRVVVYTKLVK